ncbi:MAG TPA: hypothetical protein VIK18_11900 [Pirellulales bacterium]
MFARCWLSVALAVAAVFAGASTAGAHFVWIESEEHGDQVLVRSGFGEADGWDPDLIDRMQAVQFWLRTPAGLQPLDVPLNAKEHEYRAEIPAKRPLAILAKCDFGVVQLGGKAPTWLRYTAKSLFGPAAAWADDRPTTELRIELLATFERDHVRLTAWHLGQPLAAAKIKATSPKGDRIELVTDSKGIARWRVDAPGVYVCYVGTTVQQAGERDRKPYETLKDYTTLTFRIGDKH